MALSREGEGEGEGGTVGPNTAIMLWVGCGRGEESCGGVAGRLSNPFFFYLSREISAVAASSTHSSSAKGWKDVARRDRDRERERWSGKRVAMSIPISSCNKTILL